MDYRKIYDKLIEFRKINKPEGYTENHHILPKSLGGSNDKDNLVELTGREHWIAHLLLYKITKSPQMAHACNMMAMRCEERGIKHIKNSRMYEKIRIECAKLFSDKMKLKTGDKSSQFGTMWIYNSSLRQNKKILKTDDIPEGWIKGRKINEKTYTENFNEKRRIRILSKQKKIAEDTLQVFEEFEKSEFCSLTQFLKCRKTNCTGPGMLIRFARLVPDYKNRLNKKCRRHI